MFPSSRSPILESANIRPDCHRCGCKSGSVFIVRKCVVVTEIKSNQVVRVAYRSSVRYSEFTLLTLYQLEIVAGPGDNFFHTDVPAGQTLFATASWAGKAKDSFAARM